MIDIYVVLNRSHFNNALSSKWLVPDNLSPNLVCGWVRRLQWGGCSVTRLQAAAATSPLFCRSVSLPRHLMRTVID